jgi:hypothetical protein
MTEAWSKLRIPRARLSPSGPVPLAGPRTGPPTGEQFAALAVLAAIAAQQGAAVAAQQDASAAQPEASAAQPDAARQEAASTSTRPQHQPRHGAGDQPAALFAEIEAAQRNRPQPY